MIVKFIQLSIYPIHHPNANLCFYALSEKDVLKYLKSHPKVAKDLKQAKPDIIESWKHYQEIEKLCAELEE